MGAKQIVKTTTNRGEFNRVYKEHLERTGKIRCSRCRYHRSENIDHNWYGGFFNENKNEYQVRIPNWKLVSKQQKQWMKKPIRITEEISKYNSKVTYVEIKFST